MRLRVTKHSPAYWRVTLDNPPLNIFDPEMIEELKDLTDSMEKEEALKVVVFDSANPDYFIAHIDVINVAKFDLKPAPSGLAPWPEIARRWNLAPFITIGLIRGRARAVGSEFIQALDMRFASREKAIFAQAEVGFGLIPGGGGLERLPGLIGRARAMEVIIGADDFDADTAALYGWINRAIPDAELDDFVDKFARRIAGFEKNATSAVKHVIYKRLGTAKVEEFAETQTIFFNAISQPSVQGRITQLVKRGLQQEGSFELNLGASLGS